MCMYFLSVLTSVVARRKIETVDFLGVLISNESLDSIEFKSEKISAQIFPDLNSVESKLSYQKLLESPSYRWFLISGLPRYLSPLIKKFALSNWSVESI